MFKVSNIFYLISHNYQDTENLKKIFPLLTDGVANNVIDLIKKSFKKINPHKISHLTIHSGLSEDQFFQFESKKF